MLFPISWQKFSCCGRWIFFSFFFLFHTENRKNIEDTENGKNIKATENGKDIKATENGKNIEDTENGNK